MALTEYLATEVAEDFADGLLSRRDALRKLGLLGLTLTSASALLAACGGDDDNPVVGSTPPGAATSAAATPTPSVALAEVITFAGSSGELKAAWAPATTPKASLLVIHENRGLTPHFHELVQRLAGQGYSSMCIDLLSKEGGTAAVDDPGAALNAAGETRLVADLRAGVGELLERVPGKKVGAVGFCFGGMMAWNLLQAGETRLAAVAPFYGPAPDAPDFSKAKAAVLGVYGGTDTRVNASRDRAEAALKKAGLTYQIRTFEGAGHAFFNDTNPERYNAAAAAEAQTELLAWFGTHLA